MATRTTTGTGRARITSTDRGAITSKRKSVSRGRRTTTTGRPERWLERAMLTLAPPTLPRAQVAVKMKAIGPRIRRLPRTRAG
jgi:hypothetical protein